MNKLAARANVKTVVLSHLSARAGTDDYTPWAEEVKKQFSGQGAHRRRPDEILTRFPILGLESNPATGEPGQRR